MQSGSLSKCEMGSSNNTIQIKVIDQDGYEVSLKIIKSNNTVVNQVLFPAFVFIPPMTGSVQDVLGFEELAKLIVTESGRITGVILTNEGDVFDYFAALKWLFRNGEEVGVDITKVAVVGYRQGANVATLLSLMAYHDGLPEISIQVLIDPRFFNRGFENLRKRKLVADTNGRDWLNKDCIHNLPLELVDGELAGTPPTAMLFLNKSRICYEVEDYCIKLLKSGKMVNYLICDRVSGINHDKDFLRYTVAQLMYLLLPEEN